MINFDLKDYIISNYDRVSGSKLSIDIDTKSFFYKGDKDTGYFIEDLANQILLAVNIPINPNEKPIQVVMEFYDRVYLITLRDIQGVYEPTVLYSVNELEMDTISSCVSDSLVNQNNAIFVSYSAEKETFGVIRERDEFEAEVYAYDIKVTKVVSGFQRIATLMSRHSGDIVAFLLVLMVPFSIYYILNKTIAGSDLEKVHKLEIQYKLLNAKQIQEQGELTRFGEKYRDIERQVDFMSDPEFATKMSAIQPTALIQPDEKKEANSALPPPPALPLMVK